MLPILLVGMLCVLIVGFLLAQVGAAARLKTEDQTAADAAALAGAKNVKEQLIRLAATGQVSPASINWPEVEFHARDYAARNGSVITSFQHVIYDVKVETRSIKGLDAENVGRNGARSTSKARASILSVYNVGSAVSNIAGGFSAGGSGSSSGGGGGGARSANSTAAGPNPIPESELKAIEKKAGVKIRSDSALVRYAFRGEGDGPNVAQLDPKMKVGIAKAEDLLGHGLTLNSAYRSAAYQAVLCNSGTAQGGRCAPPGQSLHNFGLAIDTSMFPELAQVATKAGLCQPFPGPGDDNVHFSPIDGPECGGKGGPLPAGQAFGGNVANFVQYNEQLVPYDGGSGLGF